MADITKTVAILFTADDKASQVSDKLAENIKAVGDAAVGSNAKLDQAGASLEKIGKTSSSSAESTKQFGDGLRKLAEDAGAPEPVLKSMDSVLGRIGAAGGGSAVIAASAIAALAITFGKVGLDAAAFKTSLENVSGGAIDSEKALQFVVDVTKRIESNLNDTLDAYQRFLIGLEGTGISATAAEKAFEGILKAVEGIGGSSGDAQKALDAFAKIARDGGIKLKELDAITRDIPGGMRILSEALGAPADDLRKLAEDGKLGKEAIEAFAAALSQQNYEAVGLGGLSNAFNDLLNTLKIFALDLGADGAIGGGLWILEKSIRAVTVGVTIGVESLKLFGETLANIAFTAATLDFAGFMDRQNEIIGGFNKNVEGAVDKLLGLDNSLKASEGPKAAASAYSDLASKLNESGDKAKTSAAKTVDADKAARDAAKSALEWEREENKKNATLLKSAELAQKAEEAAQKYALEMEKLASNERIKSIEARVELNVAQIEADTKRIEAMFESINNTIDSTGEVIGDALGALKGFNSEFDPGFQIIKDQLDKENALRREAFDMQKKLTEAQIEIINAQVRALNNGDVLIKVDGAGLQPHLEAFMFEVLKAIQVRLNQQGMKALLGIP